MITLLLTLCACLFSASDTFAQTSVAQIVVRSYNAVGVSLPTLGRAESTVHDLLSEAGIDSTWRTCRMPDGPTARSQESCGEVVKPSEFIVRIVRAPRAVADAEVLGYSHVDPYQRQGTLATVFADRVRALATALQIDEGTLLGRAITHEIGHLLLGTLDHSHEGLMRGHWSKQGRAADWFFTSMQAQEIRGALLARTNSGAPAIALVQSTR